MDLKGYVDGYNQKCSHQEKARTYQHFRKDKRSKKQTKLMEEVEEDEETDVVTYLKRTWNKTDYSGQIDKSEIVKVFKNNITIMLLLSACRWTCLHKRNSPVTRYLSESTTQARKFQDSGGKHCLLPTNMSFVQL